MKPNILSVDPLVAWTKATTSACSNLYSMDTNITPATMVQVIEVLMKNYQSQNKNVSLSTTQSISKLINHCVKESWIENALLNYENYDPYNEIEGQQVTFLKFLYTLEEGLSFKNLTSVPQILLLIKQIFIKLRKNCFPLLCKILYKVAGIFETNSIPQLNKDIKDILSISVKMMGPKLFLSVLPLNLEVNNQNSNKIPRTYLLPILKDNIRNTELIFFVAYFVPLIQQLTEHAKKLNNVQRGTDAKNTEVIVNQMWSLLESFCLFPTDLQKSFPSIAKSMAGSLQSNTLIEPICRSIVNIIKSQESSITFNNSSSKDKQENTNLEKFLKNINDEDEDDSSFVPDDEDEDNYNEGSDDDEENEEGDDEQQNESEVLPYMGKESVDENEKEDVDSTYNEEGMDQSESSDVFEDSKKPNKTKKLKDPFLIMCKEILNHISNEQAQENQKNIANFSGHLIPNLFNCFTKANQSDKENLILKSIQSYFSISPPEQVNQYFKDVMISMIKNSYMNISNSEELTKTELSDEVNKKKKERRKINVLTGLFIPYLSKENSAQIFNIISTVLKDSPDNSAKKVALHSLSNLCKKNSIFAVDYFDQVIELLMKTQANLNKKSKISCWLELSKIVVASSADEFIKKCISEALLGTKDKNVKTRKRSSKLILSLCDVYSQKMDKSISDFVVLLLAALAGKSPRIVSSTINAVGVVFYKHKSKFFCWLFHYFLFFIFFQKKKKKKKENWTKNSSKKLRTAFAFF